MEEKFRNLRAVGGFMMPDMPDMPDDRTQAWLWSVKAGFMLKHPENDSISLEALETLQKEYFESQTPEFWRLCADQFNKNFDTCRAYKMVRSIETRISK